MARSRTSPGKNAVLIITCAVVWIATIGVGARLGGAVRHGPGAREKWALPPLAILDLLRRGALDSTGQRLLPWYLGGVVLSSVLFIGVAIRMVN